MHDEYDIVCNCNCVPFDSLASLKLKPKKLINPTKTKQTSLASFFKKK